MAATPAPPPLDPRLVEILQAALATHSVEVLLRAWRLTEPLMPVAVLMEDVKQITETAQAHGITRPQFDDAIALLGYLRSSDKEHYAWLAAELVYRHCQNRGNFEAALQAAYQPPSKEPF